MLASAVACGACSRPRSADPPRTPAHAGASDETRPRELAATRGPLIGEYTVRYDGRGALTVEATLARAGRSFSVERGTEPFLQGLEVAAAVDEESPPAWQAAGREGRSFVAPPCAAGRCRLRYRYALREAAKRIDDLDVASEEGELIEAPPSTWLLAPADADPSARIRFRVSTTEETVFSTGVFRSREVPDAWDIAIGDLWTSPYSLFGPARVRTLDVEGARLDLAIAPGKLSVSDDDLASWTRDAARAITTYFGRFPMPEALVILVPGRGRWVGEGKTLSGGGGAIFVRIGENATPRALRDDWVLVHEMTHLAFPSVGRGHDWAEEGLATYVEPFARARAGLLSAEDAWLGLTNGLPNGLPAAGDRGLDRTPTWGRTYWGGALFYLLADIEIRKRTNGRLGLEHALRGILAEGGNNAHRWALDETFAAGDRATGVPVLHELHDAMGTSPHPVDLDALWRQLGVVRGRGAVRFEDGAPLGSIRRAITTPESR